MAVTKRSTPFPILLLLFVGSGCAALIYEIVWFQLLELSIGSSAISIGVLLATYMGGMFVGSLGLSRWVSADRHPMRVYAFIELGIAVCALIVLWLVPYAGGLYASIGGHGIGGLLFRGLLSAVCLMPPTILMGATLPAVSRWIESTPRGVERLGFLYGGNTLGAVIGCLLAGFYLLRVFDMVVATLVAVVINLAIGGAALWISRTTAYEPLHPKKNKKPSEPPRALWPVLVTIGLSGMTALSAEVVWTRVLSLQLGATVYTYSLILAAVLLGIGIGSSIGSVLTRSGVAPRLLLGLCQSLLIVGIVWSAYLLTAVFPYKPHDAALSMSLMVTFWHDLSLSLSAILPAALLWGASFPLALAAVAGPERDPGRSVGLVYAANTAGAIIGSLGTSLVAMALIGSQRIQQVLIGLAMISALLMFVPLGMGRKRKNGPATQMAYLAAVPLVLAALLVGTVRPVPGNLVGYGPGSSAWKPEFGSFIYVGEGMNSSVAVSRLTNGVLNYHNAGKVQASSEPADLRLERMLGHLTTLQVENPESVLVIGCGAGVTAGAVSIDPQVKRLTVVEIEPLVPEAAQTYFASVNEGVVANPKTDVIIDDGRHYLMTSHEKFDAITLDPFDPWTKGAASLSTRQFYESAKAHLSPGGSMTVWVPLYQTRAETVKSEIATFMSVFPNAVIWDNVTSGGGDVVLSGRVDDSRIDLSGAESKVLRPEYKKVRDSLATVGFASAEELFATFGAQGEALKIWSSGAEINTDRNLRLQYLAGVGFGAIDPESIYQNMVLNRSWPDSLFSGSPKQLQSLRARMGF